MSPDPNDTCWTVLRAATTGDADARSTFAPRYEPTIRFILAARWRGRFPRVAVVRSLAHPGQRGDG